MSTNGFKTIHAFTSRYPGEYQNFLVSMGRRNDYHHEFFHDLFAQVSEHLLGCRVSRDDVFRRNAGSALL